MAADQYVLGYGIFAVAGVDIGLTRGGGTFSVEREYKIVEADGDYGPVKGRVRIDKSVAKLSFNTLEILSSNLPKFYPGTDLDTTTVPGTATLTGKAIEDADYNATVTFTGTTADGDAVIIELENAINLENIDWSLVDKDELVTNIVYTGTYLNTARSTEPWSIDYVTP